MYSDQRRSDNIIREVANKGFEGDQGGKSREEANGTSNSGKSRGEHTETSRQRAGGTQDKPERTWRGSVLGTRVRVALRSRGM